VAHLGAGLGGPSLCPSCPPMHGWGRGHIAQAKRAGRLLCQRRRSQEAPGRGQASATGSGPVGRPGPPPIYLFIIYLSTTGYCHNNNINNNAFHADVQLNACSTVGATSDPQQEQPTPMTALCLFCGCNLALGSDPDLAATSVATTDFRRDCRYTRTRAPAWHRESAMCLLMDPIQDVSSFLCHTLTCSCNEMRETSPSGARIILVTESPHR